MEKMIAAIDVGTTKICTLVGEVTEAGDLHIASVGIAPSRGLHKGVVVSVKEATEAIATSIEKAERVSGYHIEKAYVGVTGAHISCLNSRGVVATTGQGGTIDETDIERAMEAALAIAIHHDSDIIHAIPRAYVVDGQEGVRDPVGMRGLKLEVEAHVVTGAVSSLDNLVNCVERTGVEVAELVLEPLASAEAILSSSEQEMGVALADVGGGTTDIAIFAGGNVCHTAVLNTGGNHLTYDLAVGLRLPFHMAEEAKIQYGHALPASINGAETFEIDAFGEDEPQVFSRQQLAEVLYPRCTEIFELIVKEVNNSGYGHLLPAGLVICGGTAELDGFRTIGREVLDMPIRIGTPHDLDGLVDVISSPAYATSVGLLLWGQHHDRGSKRPVRKRSRNSDVINRFFRWLRVFLPE